MSSSSHRSEFEKLKDAFVEDSDSDSDSDSDGGVFLVSDTTTGSHTPVDTPVDTPVTGSRIPAMKRYAGGAMFPAPLPENLPIPSFIVQSKTSMSTLKNRDQASSVTNSLDCLSTKNHTPAVHSVREEKQDETLLQFMLRHQVEGMSGPWEGHAKPATHVNNVLHRQDLGDMKIERVMGGLSLLGGRTSAFGSPLDSKAEGLKEKLPAMSYRDVTKTGAAGKSVPAKSGSWLTLKPKATTQATASSSHQVEGHRNTPPQQAAGTSQNLPAQSLAVSKIWGQTDRGRTISQLSSWRVRSEPKKNESVISTTASTSSRLPPPPSTSYVSIASNPVGTKGMVVALPKEEDEAERVARQVKEYRQYHGLSQASHFTPMIKVEAEQAGIRRPQAPFIGMNTPIEHSTAVYLKGLPAATTYKDLLENVRAGKIWHTYIDAPNPPLQPSAAAKVAFCTRASALKFVEQIKLGQYSVCGQRMYAGLWDRRCEPERRNMADTRCIQIQGPAIMMEWSWFEREFATKMDLKITEFFEVHSKDVDSKIFQINFAGIFAQSRAVVKALEKDYSDIYSYRYIPDPCDN